MKPFQMRVERRPVDRFDRKIIALLQEDATLSIAQISHHVGLSQTPCWKRIQRLEAEGVILRRVTVISPESIGLSLTAFVSVEVGDHSREALHRFSQSVSAMPEVMEIFRLAGDVDYLLKVVVADMAEYDGFYKRLIEAAPLKNVISRFAMERVKSTTAYTVDCGSSESIGR
jgi:Lrp/AsnC family transcriptional regulator